MKLQDILASGKEASFVEGDLTISVGEEAPKNFVCIYRIANKPTSVLYHDTVEDAILTATSLIKILSTGHYNENWEEVVR